jgi:hypothetical protein
MTRLDLVGELLRHEDIEGLLSMGAPDDEYESEAEMIADRIDEEEAKAVNHMLTRQDVESIIASVWGQIFGLDAERAGYRQHAFTAIAARLVP